jgi:hypothetical protein
MWFRKALVRQSVQHRTTFRPKLESLEDRVTPSISVTSSLLSAVPDVPVATTSGQIQMEAPPVAIPIVHGASGLGWGSLYTGITIKGQALDASGARLIQVGYAQDPVSSDIDLFVGYTLLSDGSGSGTLFNFAGMNTKGAGVDVDATGIIYAAGTQGSQGFMMRVETDLATVDWAATAGLNLTGAKLDTAGTNLYVGGADAGSHATDNLAVKLNDLANPAGPHQVYYDIRSSGVGPSRVQGITVDANGRADLATSVDTGDPQNPMYNPSIIQVEPDGSNKPGWYFIGQGDMNGVALAPDGTWILVGNIAGANKDVISVKMANNIQGDPVADFPWGGGWVFDFGADATANAVAIDNNGDYYYGGSLANAPDPTNMLYIKNSGVDGATQLDGFTIVFGPGQTGVVYAITLDGLGNAYVAGTLDADGVIVQVTGI